MSDLKISELVSATSVAETDYFVIVQAGETRKITPAVMCTNVTNSLVCKELPETLSSGVISPTVLTTIISSAPSTNQIFTLGSGVHGTSKEIVVGTLASTFTATINVLNGKGFTSLTFTSIGQTISLKFISGYWYVMAYKGVTIV